ncbi:MAG: hypothetical protein IH623_31055 [Verrucomicrobia bacterium]|nr:hypothetical protein [Verrucomicrobiota bacterium]
MTVNPRAIAEVGSLWLRLLIAHPAWALTLLAALGFGGSLAWAQARDPFDRIWFTVKTPAHGKTEGVAVLPKSAGKPLPVVMYLHGAGGSLRRSGNELRQMAEMGLAVVGLEYDQTNMAAFHAQFIALHQYVMRQKWAETNVMAWVGFSLGAQRQLSFQLMQTEWRPELLVRLAGGWVPELESFDRAFSTRPSFHGQRESGSGLLASASGEFPRVLILHGDQDNVFPLADAGRTAACLRTNGVSVSVSVLPGQTHTPMADRGIIFRAIGEHCLTELRGAPALSEYRSVAAWQAGAKPLLFYWLPALFWSGLWLFGRNRLRRIVNTGVPHSASALSSGEKPVATTARRMMFAGAPKRTPLRIGLWWVAAVLAILAIAWTALHLIPPRLTITDKTLTIARKYLIQPGQQADFDSLATESVWPDKRLQSLLTHVELAGYNRRLVNWELEDDLYRNFVLSPWVSSEEDKELDWRRPLWESLYPRIRRETDLASAAGIVVRHLRERVSITEGESLPVEVETVWRRQITNAKGFERIYVAALRSVGVPARLNPQGRAEFWTPTGWQPAPRPLIEALGE